ncbi:MAG: nucleotide disphospho-sugar-binding domain-containing protein [Bryobacteraceae bacterium]
MPRFLLATWGFESHLDTFLAVGKELRLQGHEVAIYTDPSHRSDVESIGARLLPFHDLSQEAATEIIDKVIANRGRPWKLWSWWRQFLIGTIPAQLSDLRRAINTYAPDVLVSDMAMWGPMVVLQETTSIPVAILSHIGFSLQPGKVFGPVAGRAMPPRRTGIQRLRARLVTALSGAAARDARKVVNQIRQAEGLAPVSIRMTELCSKMDLCLIPTSRRFDYNRDDLPASVRYVGPCLFPAMPPPLVGSSGPRTIVVDEGTLYTKDAVMAQCARQLTGYRIRILAGMHRDPSELEIGAASEDAKVKPWQPVQYALDGVNAVVTNGNTESVMAALMRGLPVVVVPSIMDQHEMALRVVECGAGISLPEKQCTPQALQIAVARLFAEPSFRENAERMGKELRGMDGPKLAALHLQHLAGSHVHKESLSFAVSR